MTVDPLKNEAIAQGMMTTPGQPYLLPPGTYDRRVRWEICTPSGDVVGLGVGDVGQFTRSVDPTGVTTCYLPVFGDGVVGNAHPKADDAPPGQGPQP